MKIYLIGTGMEGIRTLTAEAEAAIAQAELLIGAERMLVPYRNTRTIFCSYQPEEIAARLRTGTERCAAVLLSGDCGFFSGARKLLTLLEGEEVQMISGISAPVYLCARTGISWEQMQFVSLHGTENSIAVHVRSHRHCCFLLDRKNTAAMVCRRLCEYGLGEVLVQIGENLGYENEHMFSGTAADFLHHPPETLSVLMTDNPAFCDFLPSGIPDTEFLRTEIPMTKAEIRCISVAALEIRRNDVCWDIGCGTGSVSVEMALRCPEGMVFAADKNPEAVRLTAENSRRFGCDNIRVTEAVFPDENLPFRTPDAVFIGGSSGGLEQIIPMLFRSNPAVRIVVNAVSLETLAQAQNAFSASGAAYSVTQISAARTRKAGSHTMLTAQNPVFIIKGAMR